MESERREQAVAALAEIEEGHAAIARVRAPWWQYPALGLLLAFLPIAQTQRWFPLTSIVVLVVILGAIGVRWAARRRTGVLSDPTKTRAGLLWTIGFCVAGVGLVWIASLPAVLGTEPAPLWVGVLCGAGELLAATLYGIGLDRARRSRRWTA